MNLLKHDKFTFFIIFIASCILYSGCSYIDRYKPISQSTHVEAIQLLDDYILRNNLGITKNTSEYEIFLQDVIYWNLHPELTERDNNQLIEAYADYYLSRDYPKDSRHSESTSILNDPKTK